MASLTETLTGLKNKNTDTTASAQQRYPVQFISYTCLEGSSYNFYPMTEIDDLDLCQYFEHKKLKGYADFFNSSSSFCCGVI